MRSFQQVIQVAGIIDQAEAEMLIRNGIKYLGFPLRLTVNKEDLTDEEAGKIIRSFPEGFHGVLITYLKTAAEIISLARKISADTVQIHGEIELNEIQKLKRDAPDLFVIKSLVVREDNFEKLKSYVSNFSGFADAFITDTFDPATGAEGATGKTHDWNISKELVRLSPKPVILAGGLNPSNVKAAIEFVRPAGVDVHTGVEDTKGRKDKKLVRQFVEEAKRGFANIF